MLPKFSSKGDLSGITFLTCFPDEIYEYSRINCLTKIGLDFLNLKSFKIFTKYGEPDALKDHLHKLPNVSFLLCIHHAYVLK